MSILKMLSLYLANKIIIFNFRKSTDKNSINYKIRYSTLNEQEKRNHSKLSKNKILKEDYSF